MTPGADEDVQFSQPALGCVNWHNHFVLLFVSLFCFFFGGGTTTLNNSLAVSLNLNIHLFYDSAIPLLRK